jgi:hypothetical protein
MELEDVKDNDETATMDEGEVEDGIDLATALLMGAFVATAENPNEFLIQALTAYYAPSNEYLATWSPVIEGPNKVMDDSILYIEQLTDTDSCLVYYKPSRMAAHLLNEELKQDFHSRRPKTGSARVVLHPDSMACPDCGKWFESKAILVDHYTAIHPEAQTVEGIRNRLIVPPMRFWNHTHPINSWFVAQLRAGVRRKMSHCTRLELGAVLHVRAHRSVIVSCLVRMDDQSLRIENDPTSGTLLPPCGPPFSREGDVYFAQQGVV